MAIATLFGLAALPCRASAQPSFDLVAIGVELGGKDIFGLDIRGANSAQSFGLGHGTAKPPSGWERSRHFTVTGGYNFRPPVLGDRFNYAVIPTLSMRIHWFKGCTLSTELECRKRYDASWGFRTDPAFGLDIFLPYADDGKWWLSPKYFIGYRVLTITVGLPLHSPGTLQGD